MPGKITVFTGPMFSRKTKSMVIELERAVLGRKSFIAIKPEVDSRQSRTLENELIKILNPYGLRIPDLVFSVTNSLSFSNDCDCR